MTETIQIRPIHSEEDFDVAMERVGLIFHASPGSPEADERDILVRLIDDWQNRFHDVPVPTPQEAVRMVMEREGLRVGDLSIYFGDQSRVSNFLAGKRSLTVEQIRRLSIGFNLPLSVLIGAPDERWQVPRNRQQNVYRVVDRKLQVDGMTRFFLVEYASGERAGEYATVAENSNYAILMSSELVYRPRIDHDDFFHCDTEDGEVFVTGYSQRRPEYKELA